MKLLGLASEPPVAQPGQPDSWGRSSMVEQIIIPMPAKLPAPGPCSDLGPAIRFWNTGRRLSVIRLGCRFESCRPHCDLSLRMSRPRAHSGGETARFGPGATGPGGGRSLDLSAWPPTGPETGAFLSRSVPSTRPIIASSCLSSQRRRHGSRRSGSINNPLSPHPRSSSGRAGDF